MFVVLNVKSICYTCVQNLGLVFVVLVVVCACEECDWGLKSHLPRLWFEKIVLVNLVA